MSAALLLVGLVALLVAPPTGLVRGMLTALLVALMGFGVVAAAADAAADASAVGVGVVKHGGEIGLPAGDRGYSPVWIAGGLDRDSLSMPQTGRDSKSYKCRTAS